MENKSNLDYLLDYLNGMKPELNKALELVKTNKLAGLNKAGDIYVEVSGNMYDTVNTINNWIPFGPFEECWENDELRLKNYQENPLEQVQLLIKDLDETINYVIKHDHEDFEEYSDHEIDSEVSDEPDEDNKMVYECTALDTCALCGDARTITYTCLADADEPDGSDLIDGLSGYGDIEDDGEWEEDTNKEVLAYRASQAKEGEPAND